MSRRIVIAVTGVAAVLLIAAGVAYASAHPSGGAASEGPVSLADPAKDKTVATVDLSAGFVLDPYILRVAGAGGKGASSMGEGCVGYVDEVPDVVLNWSGEAETLSLFVYSDLDPVLVVETPGGQVFCSDDTDKVALDPAIVLDGPEAGAYSVYVGSYNKDDPAMGVLVITEADVTGMMAEIDLAPLLDRREYATSVQLLPEVTIADLYLGESGAFGDSSLSAGFAATQMTAVGGGDLPIAGLDGDAAHCYGYVSLVPTYSFEWGGGSLSAYFESEDNATLLVVTPDGDVICNDNATEDNLNPVVDIVDGAQGAYDIFVGSYRPRSVVRGVLTLTGDTGAVPVQLPAE